MGLTVLLVLHALAAAFAAACIGLLVRMLRQARRH